MEVQESGIDGNARNGCARSGSFSYAWSRVDEDECGIEERRLTCEN
jgi:hypothetical protein